MELFVNGNKAFNRDKILIPVVLLLAVLSLGTLSSTEYATFESTKAAVAEGAKNDSIISAKAF